MVTDHEKQYHALQALKRAYSTFLRLHSDVEAGEARLPTLLHIRQVQEEGQDAGTWNKCIGQGGRGTIQPTLGITIAAIATPLARSQITANFKTLRHTEADTDTQQES